MILEKELKILDNILEWNEFKYLFHFFIFGLEIKRDLHKVEKEVFLCYNRKSHIFIKSI